MSNQQNILGGMPIVSNGFPNIIGPGLENMGYSLRVDIRLHSCEDWNQIELNFISMFIEDELIAPEVLYPVNQFTTAETINVGHDYFFKTQDGQFHFLDGLNGDRYRYLKYFKKEGKTLLEAVKTIQNVEQL